MPERPRLNLVCPYCDSPVAATFASDESGYDSDGIWHSGQKEHVGFECTLVVICRASWDRNGIVINPGTGMRRS